MAAITLTTIFCDEACCLNKFEDPNIAGYGVRAMREGAKKDGWICVRPYDRHLDLCPYHAEEYEEDKSRISFK
jgi:hypothetical protein